VGVRVGIDTGGTFTDLVAVDTESGRSTVSKVPSNPGDPVAAVAAALTAAELGPADVVSVVVGTTIGINAVLTRTGARVVYLTTSGFEDIPFIQRINRKYHYDFTWRKPIPLVERPDCIGVAERLDEEGSVEEELDVDALRRSLAELELDGNGAALAICFLFSYLNPEHELTACAVARKLFPGVPVSLSHEVAPIWREYERGNTVIVDAYLKPAVERYVGGLSAALTERGILTPWSLLKSNGGHALAAEAQGRPSHVLLSGIAGGAIGGATFARLGGGRDSICLDMGGTSCDVCLVTDGEPLYSSDFEIEFGLPVSVQSVSTRTIGAGGGSIGWIDPGGFLQVGPQSTGADPGPACYGKGGDEATITDANLLLGRLDPAYFLGGRLAVDPALARAALDRLGRRLGLDATEVASAMVRVTNENMANAIRIVTVEQGIDPRGFVLVAMGGAGPTHAAEIADAIGIRRVFVPPNPGLCSAFGALAAAVRVDAVRSVFLTDRATSAEELGRLFAALEREARADFAAQSIQGTQPELRRSIAMRYQGQNYEQEVAVPPGEITEGTLAELYADYNRLYEEFYGYRLDGIPIELVRLGVVLAAPAGEVGMAVSEASGGGEAELRDVFFPRGGFLPAPIVRREALRAGERRSGPLVVEFMDSTAVVPPLWSLAIQDSGILELTRPESG
jgi:N-methylhydantoinase A